MKLKKEKASHGLHQKVRMHLKVCSKFLFFTIEIKFDGKKLLADRKKNAFFEDTVKDL